MANVTKKDKTETNISKYHNLEASFTSSKTGETVSFKLGTVAEFDDSNVELLEAIAALPGGKEITLKNIIRSSTPVSEGISEHM